MIRLSVTMSEEEVEAVLAHEIGHYKEGHIPKKLAVSFLTGLFCFLSHFFQHAKCFPL